VVLDVLQKRDPFHADSARALACAESGRVLGFIAPHSLTTLFYLIAKDRSAAEARVTLTGLLQFLSVAAVDGTTIEQALNLPYRDFEDAVQMMAAVQCKADYLVTRNKRDFQPAMVTVIQPAELAALVS
jgi:hypothetical protein